MNVAFSRPRNIVIGVVALSVIAVIAWHFFTSYISERSNTLRLGEGTFTARFADTQPERTKGLSGTASLPSDQALVFVFDRSGIWKIWMKDMNYPIDIVWLDESKKVIDIAERAAPESYPKEFVPKEKARYVIEFTSGTVEEQGISIGQLADFAYEGSST